SSSLLNNCGISPNRLLINSSADIGFPSEFQKEVFIIESISNTFLSDNLILINARGSSSQTQGSFWHCRQSGSGSFAQIHGLTPQSLHFPPFPPPDGSTGSKGSPSHSGSWKCLWAFTK